MKIVAMVPYWSGYAFNDGDIDNRGKTSLAGHSLINYLIETLSAVSSIEQIAVYSSDKSLEKFIEDRSSVQFVSRPTTLDRQDVSIEEIISSFLETETPDVVVLAHPRCPFLKSSTIASCIDRVASGEHDSAFLVTKHNRFAWYKDRPLNYTLDGNTPNLSDIEPVTLELSALYVFSTKMFDQLHRRIGLRPFMKEVSNLEAFEITEADNGEIAELIVNAGLGL